MPRKLIYQAPRRALIVLIGLYQLLISPLLGDCCRFHPTFSIYARAAIKAHGFWRGLYFTLRRLLRCQPFHPGGYDPVPQKKKGSDN